MNTKLKILIIRLSALGDILHSSIILKPIKKKYPNASISWLTQKKNQAVLESIAELDKVYSIDDNLHLLNFFQKVAAFFSLIKKIREANYHYVIDIQGLFKSGVLAFFSKAKITIGFAKCNAREFSYLFYNRKIKTKTIHNIYLKNLKLLEGLSIREPVFSESFPRFKIPSKNPLVDELLRKKKQKKFILINPWTSFKNKNIPYRNLYLIIKKINITTGLKPLLVYTTSSQLKSLKSLKKKTDFHIAPKMSLMSLFYLIKKVDFYLGCDSGPGYFSFFAKTKSVMLFGPSNATRQTPPEKFSYFTSVYSAYECPIIKKEPILTGYRCINKNCLNNKCMKKFTPSDIFDEKFFQAI